jgi:hypothetical protein
MDKKQELGNRDEREKARTLTPAEQKRLEKFEALAAHMIKEGYSRVELTVGIVRANVFAVVLLIPLFIVGYGLFLLRNRTFGGGLTPLSMLLLAVAFLALIVVHELIHGIGWALFAEHGFKDIEFGFMKQYLTPYCACLVPLTKGQYIFGALLPCVTLGVIPMIVAILVGSLPLLFLGIIMTDSAAGDILIVWKILRYRSQAKEIVYMDHPTQAGGVIFER